MDKKSHWRRIGTAALLIILGGVGLWLLGPVLLPFAVGALIAAAAEPFASRLPLPRWAAAAVCVSGVYALAGAILWFLCTILCGEMTEFARELPAMAQSLAAPVSLLRDRLLALTERFPDGIGRAMRESVAEFFRSGAGLVGRISQWVFDVASGFLKKLPDLALFLVTAVLSAYMLCARRPRLRELWQQRIPALWQQRIRNGIHRVRSVFGGWCKAQLKLMGVTFLVLTAGFLILGVRYPLLFGIGIALVDALPVFGTGTVLIPWGLVAFARGNTFLGTGLLCLYGGATLLRTALEPRLLGRQIGMEPLLTLLVIYGGYRFFGVTGMLLFPLGAMVLKQFLESGEKRIDKEPREEDNIQ